MLGLTAVIAATVVATSSYFTYKMAADTRPNAKKIQADLAIMKQEVAAWIGGLVPWSKEERELLSFSQTNQEVKKGRVVTAKGIFTSIYNEPMIVYAYKRYASKEENALLYARTSNREYLYRIREDGTSIYMNKQLVGLYEQKKYRLLTSRNQLLALMKKDPRKEFFPVQVAGREVGSIVNKAFNSSDINVRALDLIENGINDREESVFLAIAILELLDNSLKE